MPIYERTEQGQYAAYDASSPLPRKLRSLLKVIDGKTATEVYITSLESFGDVPKLLSSLQMAGLIQDQIKTSKSSDPADLQPMSDAAESARKPGFLARLRTSKADFGTSTAFQSPRTEMQTVLPSRMGQTERATRSMESAERSISGAQRRTAHARCVDEMSSFVLAHVPEQAFSILKELEDAEDLDQLAIILGGYEQMIAAAGPVAKEHVAHIKQIMRENW
jgi:hypothetical protein